MVRRTSATSPEPTRHRNWLTGYHLRRPRTPRHFRPRSGFAWGDSQYQRPLEIDLAEDPWTSRIDSMASARR
jgi:hypothetical protein